MSMDMHAAGAAVLSELWDAGVRFPLDPYRRISPAPEVLLGPQVGIVAVPVLSEHIEDALRLGVRLAHALRVAGGVRVSRLKEWLVVEVPRPLNPDGSHGDVVSMNGDAIGQDPLGRWVRAPLCDRAPHMLIGGTTGSGKTTLAQVIALVESTRGARCVLVDLKRTDRPFERWIGTGHTVCTTSAEADCAIAWCRSLIGDRLAQRVVLVIDEWKLLSATAREHVIEIAELGRSSGVCAVICTQYPTTKNIPTELTVNLPRRIAGVVPTSVASRVILGEHEDGACTLLGAGDMLMVEPAVETTRFRACRPREQDFAGIPHVEPIDLHASGYPGYPGYPARPEPQTRINAAAREPMQLPDDVRRWILDQSATDGSRMVGINRLAAHAGVHNDVATRWQREVHADLSGVSGPSEQGVARAHAHA